MMRAAALAVLTVMSGCAGYLSAFDRTLDRAEREVMQQCANLDDPANAARIDALALLSASTSEIADLRDRRERYCEIFGRVE